jgi:mannan endo-1,4-beta-mannosidase
LADTLARDKPIAIGECEILPTADELATQPRWTFFMAWAELVQNSKLVQPIQGLDTAVNVVTVGQMSEAL